GPTDAKHGILLCSFHHHEVHRGRLALSNGSNGRWHVTPALGHHAPRRTARRRAYTTNTTATAQAARPQINRRP
uniref:hypothetical protein n=1 Tax=Pseudoclavibacter terrae TaxID=1530195 RepID=UPI00232AD23E